MARIILTSGLGNQYAGGQTELEIEAPDVADVLDDINLKLIALRDA